MVLEIPIGSVVVIENQTIGQLITVSIAGAAESGKQFIAVGLPAGYQIRVENADYKSKDTNLFASTYQPNSFTNFHNSSNGQLCHSEIANLRKLQK